MAYSVEITDGSTTYTFGVDRVPEWVVNTTTDWDETKFPALLVKQTDSLVLRNCHYRNATPSNVTTDWSTIRGQLFDPSTPIVSVLLKDGAATIDKIQLTSAGGSHNQLIIRSLTPDVTGGFFANHWKGDITVEGVIYHATAALAGSAGTPGEEDEIAQAASDVAKRVRKLTISHDQHGFETRRLDVEIEMHPTTSGGLRAALLAEILPLPANNWVYATNDPEGGENIDITIEDDLADLKGSGVCVVREQAINYPDNTNEYGVVISEVESGSDKTTRTVITVQGDSIETALAVATTGVDAPTAYTEKSVSKELARNRVTASFVTTDDTEQRVRSWSIFSQGGGREREEIRMPSIGGKRDPIAFVRPKGVVRFTESCSVRRVGNPDISVPTLFTNNDNVETSVNSDVVSVVAPRQDQSTQETYERRVQRTHVFFSSPPDLAQLVKAMTTRPRPRQSTTPGYKLTRQPQ